MCNMLLDFDELVDKIPFNYVVKKIIYTYK